MSRYAFGNLLFSGPCNQRCPDCIGRQLPRRPANLDRFPLVGLERFCVRLVENGVRQLTLTGTDTDPLLYRHLDRLVDELRFRVPGLRINLHTNGRLALARIELVNRCDRACLSLPSFVPGTCARMTGRRQVLPIERILEAARIPIKVSVLVTGRNVAEVPAIIARCRELGLRRLVLRRCLGEGRRWPLLAGRRPVRRFAGNPVYDLDGLEVTVWDFERSALGCLNLFSDGTITERYLLEHAREERDGPRAAALG